MNDDNAGWMNRARTDGRDFTDGQGTRWRIYEIVITPGHRRLHLICESAAVVRRVTTYPSDWRSRSEPELERICSGQ